MIEYVKMTQVHISQVAQLEAQCFSMPWSEASIAGELSNPLALWIVATDADKVLGYVGSQSVLGEADMMNLAVCADARRSGIGKELVNTLVCCLKEAQVNSLTLEVRASNQPAIALYLGLGFVQVGRRPGYYKNPKEDALILRKEWAI